jgi:hypothetical protein
VGPFEKWVRRLRLAWMGSIAAAIWAAFAAILGDRAANWARRAQLEHLPEKALDPQSLSLIGSERQLDQGVDETDAAYATRLTHAVDYWRLAGTAKGLLLQLYFAGYTDAVLIQQNGKSYRLDTLDADDPTQTDVIKEDGPELIAPLTSHTNASATPIPAGEPWYTFDGDIEHCSRFAVLLPTQPDFWRHEGVATFTDDETASVTWSQAFPSTTYNTMIGTWQGEEFVELAIPPTSKTTTGATVQATDTCTGTVAVLAWAADENPLCCPTDEALAQIRRVIQLWRPAKALCVGIYAIVRGRCFDYPTVTFGDITTFHPSEVVEFSAT